MVNKIVGGLGFVMDVLLRDLQGELDELAACDCMSRAVAPEMMIAGRAGCDDGGGMGGLWAGSGRQCGYYTAYGYAF